LVGTKPHRERPRSRRGKIEERELKKFENTFHMVAEAEEIARLLAGAEASAWLTDVVLTLVHMTIRRRWEDAELLTREDLHHKLCRLRDAAALIAGELYSPSVRDFLRWAPFHTLFSDHDLKQALQTMSDRIDVALRSEALVVAPGRVNKGPGPARAPMRPPPQIYVTVVVAEMWGHFRLGPPAPHGRKIAEIAERLWVLAGGAPHSKGDEPLAVWGPRFVKVLNRSSDAQVEEVLEIIRGKMRECLATEGRSLRLPGQEKKHDTVGD
jgi:hypothetical protein